MSIEITTNGVTIPEINGKYNIQVKTDPDGNVCPPVELNVVGGRLMVLRSQLSSTGPLWVRIFAGNEVPFNDAVQGLVAQHTARAYPVESQPVPPVPGWKTSEFWNGIVAKLLSLAVAFGAFAQPAADTLGKGLGFLVAAVFTLAALGASAHYATQRTTLKREALLGKRVTPNGSMYS